MPKNKQGHMAKTAGDILRSFSPIRRVGDDLLLVVPGAVNAVLETTRAPGLRRELANLKIAAGGVEKHEHTVVTPDLAASLAREVFGSPSALERKPDGPSQDRASDVAGNVLPLPAPVDK